MSQVLDAVIFQLIHFAQLVSVLEYTYCVEISSSVKFYVTGFSYTNIHFHPEFSKTCIENESTKST